MPPTDTAQASRERHLPRCSAPGAPGAAISRSTYSAKKNPQTIWNPASSAPAEANRQLATVSANMIPIPTATIAWCAPRNTRAAVPGVSGLRS